MKFAFKLLATAAVTIAAGTAVPANAATYLLNYTIGSGNVTGSITTDGVLGSLSASDISAFDLLLNDGVGTFDITNSNAAVGISGNTLTATSTGLSFNFSGSGYALFQAPNLGSSMTFFCLEAGSACTGTNSGSTVDVHSVFPGQHISQEGTVQFASVKSAVPEPATWAMMLMGFGAIGFAMRRRQKLTTRVSYAI